MRYLITAGPTREPIDEVRFISNRSSGRMGLAIAEAALDAGHEVTLLMGLGATAARELEDDEEWPDLELDWFDTTAELEHLLSEYWPAHDVLVMAAAVADYRPVRRIGGKLPRSEQGMTIELESTPDLVAHLASRRRSGQIVVAFAVEERTVLVDRATEKLKRKGVDAIVANPLATMDAPDVDAMWIVAGQSPQASGKLAKAAFGAWLIERIDALASK